MGGGTRRFSYTTAPDLRVTLNWHLKTTLKLKKININHVLASFAVDKENLFIFHCLSKCLYWEPIHGIKGYFNTIKQIY